jgi:hypothetical protein
MKPGPHHKPDSNNYRLIGGALTGCWFIVVGVYIWSSGNSLLGLEPNELGDFLAGILGPIGILWLILGFWQQGDELRSSVRALELQSEELRNSVEQQKELVEVARLQFKTEFEELIEERNRRRRAEHPTLHIANHGGQSSGVEMSSTMKLTNLGADCTDVKVLNCTSEFPSVLGRTGVLRRDGDYLFKINHRSDDHQEIHIDVTYTARSGEPGKVQFNLVRVSNDSTEFAVSKLDP